MTAKRQIAAIEASLDPLEAVLQVIAEAQEFGSLRAYVHSIADQPVEVAPLTRIGRQAEASVRAAMKGRKRDEVEAAVYRAVGDAVFRYILFVRLNTAALDTADREGLRAAAAFYWMGCLLGGPREGDLEPEEWVAHQAEQAECWQQWRGAVANLLLRSIVEDDAREQLEARYLDRRPALMADTAEAWDRFADQVDRLWSMCEKLVPQQEDEAAQLEKADISPLDQRVADRAKELADDARVSTFERLGDMPRAVAIMEQRLGSAG